MIVLETPRLLLRHWEEDDAPAMFAIFGEAEVFRHLKSGPLASMEEARARIASLRSADRWAHWAMIERQSQSLVGSCGFRPPDARGRPELGFTVGRTWQRRGFAVEAASAALELAFDRGVSEVTAWTSPKNAGARRVLERIGMRLWETQREDDFEWCVYLARATTPPRD